MSKDIWVISDTHWNHTNVIEYSNRPFSNSKEMDDYIVEKWNSTVKPGDKVYHLGDVYFGNKPYIHDLLNKLHGQKRLVLGNHDDAKDKILQKFFRKIVVWRMFPEFGLLLTHVPVHESSLYKTGRKGQPDFQLTNVHGHIHERPSPSVFHRNVCVEQIDYTPINIEELRTR